MGETSEVEFHTLKSFVHSPIKLNSPKSITRAVRKYQIHAKTYSPKWELDPNYRGWVQRSQSGDGFFYCLACNKNYTCGKSELDKHASSKKHCLNLKTLNASLKHTDGSLPVMIKTDGDSVESMILDDMNTSCTSFGADEVCTKAFSHIL